MANDGSGGLFAGFRQTVGVTGTKDDQQSRTMLNFGAYKGQLLGTGDSDIARPMSAGRHDFSSQVQTAYDIAGLAVPDDIQQQLEQLDSIAISSQAVAQMDPLTRVKAIGDGYSEFDPQRILEAEADIMRNVRNAAGQVLAIDKQIERDKNIADLVGKQITNATDALALDQAERLSGYAQSLSNTTMEELAAASSAGEGIGDVPIVAVQNEYVRRLQQEAEIQKMTTGSYLDQLAGTLGLSPDTATSAQTAATSAAGTVNMISRSLTPEAINGIIEQARQDYDPKTDGHVVMGTIVGPNGNAVKVPVATLMAAQQQAVKMEADMGESLAKTFRSQATVQASLYDVEMASIFSVLQNTGRAVAPEQIQQNYGEVLAIEQAFQASYGAGNIEGMTAAVTKLGEFKEKLIDSVLPSEDDPSYQAAMDNMLNGRPVSDWAVASDLASSAAAGGISLGVTPNSIFAEVAPVLEMQLARVNADGTINDVYKDNTGEGEDGEQVYSLQDVMNAGRSTGGAGTAAERNIARGQAVFSEINRQVLGKEFTDQVRGVVAEDGLRNSLSGIATALAQAAQEVPAQERGAIMAQLRAVDEMRTMLFGKFPDTGSFESGGGSVTGLLTTSTIPAEYIADENGNIIPGKALTDPNSGAELTTTSISPGRYAQVIDLFDIQLKESGVDLKAITGYSTLNEVVANDMRDNVANIATQFVPQTLRDKELMLLVSEDYRRNSTDTTGYMSAVQVAQAATAEVIAYMEAQSAEEVLGQLQTRNDLEIENAERKLKTRSRFSEFSITGLRDTEEARAELNALRTNSDSVGRAVADELTRNGGF